MTFVPRSVVPVVFPFVEVGTAYSKHLTHEEYAVIRLFALDEGVPYCRDFAKYAAAFFSISISSLALASSF